MALAYEDFDLEIRKHGDAYEVRVRSSPGGEAQGAFALPFSAESIENMVLRVGRARRTRGRGSAEIQAARAFGKKLFEALFANEVLAAYRSSLAQVRSQDESGLRIRLHLQDAPALSDLPWEYLYDSQLDRFPAQSNQTPVVRYVELAERIRPYRLERPLKILGMVSSPSDEPPLDVAHEKALINDIIAPLQKRGLAEIHWLETGTLSDLQSQLREDRYHVFHFIGHGGFDASRNEGTLVFEDENGRAWDASVSRLAPLLHDEPSLRLAVLNACEGARNTTTDPFAGVATTLVRQGLPAVVAMQFEITDDAAITFAEEFYSALAMGMPVDASVAEARKAIYAQPNDLEWGTPVLYMRTGDGVVFEVDDTEVLVEPADVVKVETVDRVEDVEPVQQDVGPGVRVPDAPRPKRGIKPVYLFLALPVLIAAMYLLVIRPGCTPDEPDGPITVRFQVGQEPESKVLPRPPRPDFTYWLTRTNPLDSEFDVARSDEIERILPSGLVFDPWDGTLSGSPLKELSAPLELFLIALNGNRVDSVSKVTLVIVPAPVQGKQLPKSDQKKIDLKVQETMSPWGTFETTIETIGDQVVVRVKQIKPTTRFSVDARAKCNEAISAVLRPLDPKAQLFLPLADEQYESFIAGVNRGTLAKQGWQLSKKFRPETDGVVTFVLMGEQNLATEPISIRTAAASVESEFRRFEAKLKPQASVESVNVEVGREPTTRTHEPFVTSIRLATGPGDRAHQIQTGVLDPSGQHLITVHLGIEELGRPRSAFIPGTSAEFKPALSSKDGSFAIYTTDRPVGSEARLMGILADVKRLKAGTSVVLLTSRGVAKGKVVGIRTSRDSLRRTTYTVVEHDIATQPGDAGALLAIEGRSGYIAIGLHSKSDRQTGSAIPLAPLTDELNKRGFIK